MGNSNPTLEKRDEIWYVKGETEPFTGTDIFHWRDGWKWYETPYVNGKRHGTEIWYGKDGSKYKKPLRGRQKAWYGFWYGKDGSKRKPPTWTAKGMVQRFGTPRTRSMEKPLG